MWARLRVRTSREALALIAEKGTSARLMAHARRLSDNGSGPPGSKKLAARANHLQLPCPQNSGGNRQDQ